MIFMMSPLYSKSVRFTAITLTGDGLEQSSNTRFWSEVLKTFTRDICLQRINIDLEEANSWRRGMQEILLPKIRRAVVRLLVC